MHCTCTYTTVRFHMSVCHPPMCRCAEDSSSLPETMINLEVWSPAGFNIEHWVTSGRVYDAGPLGPLGRSELWMSYNRFDSVSLPSKSNPVPTGVCNLRHFHLTCKRIPSILRQSSVTRLMYICFQNKHASILREPSF